ncbi:hypothetical protein ACQY0O_006561 [Thecaphora frezii]
MAPLTLPILHFNDVYRVRQSDTKTGATIGADQFAAKIARIRQSWGEPALLANPPPPPPPTADDGIQQRDWSHHAASRERKGLVLFSGDLYSPSVESSVTRGTHLVPVINAFHLDCACLGNHDWDFGYPHLQTLMAQNNFPWLFSNVVDVGDGADQQVWDEDPKDDDRRVPGTLQSWTTTVNGVKVGCIGIVEKEWIATVPAFPPGFVYRNMVKTALQLSHKLRDPAGEACELVIAITHSRLPNDIDFANAVGAVASPDPDQHGVDLVLGGHDHIYYVGNGAAAYEGDEFGRGQPGTENDQAALVVKSGTDFRDLSELKLELSERDEAKVRRRTIQRLSVRRHRASPDDPAEPELATMLDELLAKVSQSTGQAVAYTMTAWDVRSEEVRTDESAIGDFVADVLMESYEDLLRERDQRGELDEPRPLGVREVDCCIICGGSLRGDQVYGPGRIALSDVLEIMPFEDAVVCKELKGQDIWDALENGLSMYPKQEGRFPQVAGLKVVWDSRKPPGQRLVSVDLLERPLDSASTPRCSGTGGDGGSGGDGGTDDTASKLRSYTVAPDEGGYSATIHRPALRMRGQLEMDKTYRVVTREYLAEGYDGFEALTRGKAVVDEENGQLMSAIVRRFLLGASYLWRMKQVCQVRRGTVATDGAEEMDVDEGGGEKKGEAALRDGKEEWWDEPKTLSKRTKQAVLRARALVALRKGAGHDGAPETRLESNEGIERVELVVDHSPGGVRDALYIGGSEHHSAHDAVMQRFAEGGGEGGRWPELKRSRELPACPDAAGKRTKVDKGEAGSEPEFERQLREEAEAENELLDPENAPTLLARIGRLCRLLEAVGGKEGKLVVPSAEASGGEGRALGRSEEAAPTDETGLMGASSEDDYAFLPTLSLSSGGQAVATPLSNALVEEARGLQTVLSRLKEAAERLEGGEMDLEQQTQACAMLETYVGKQREVARRFGAVEVATTLSDVRIQGAEAKRLVQGRDGVAVVAPLRDGRLVDLARGERGE